MHDRYTATALQIIHAVVNRRHDRSLQGQYRKKGGGPADRTRSRFSPSHTGPLSAAPSPHR